MLLIVSIILAGQGLAKADERADELTAQGNALGKEGDFHGALALLKQALALSPGAKERCNVGGVYFKLKRWTEAYLYLDLCVRSPVVQTDKAYLKAMSDVLNKVEKTVADSEFALVRFEVTPDNANLQVSALPGDVYFSAQQKLWLPTGTHRVSVKADGFVDHAGEVRVAKGGQSIVQIVLSKKVSEAPLDPKPLEPNSPKQVTPKDPIELSPSGNPSKSATTENPSAPSKLPAIASLSLGAASLTGGVIFYLSASSAADKADGLSPGDPNRADLQDRFNTRRIASYSLFGVGAIATLLGTYWILGSESKVDSRTSFRANFSQGGARFSGHWRF